MRPRASPEAGHFLWVTERKRTRDFQNLPPSPPLPLLGSVHRSRGGKSHPHLILHFWGVLTPDPRSIVGGSHSLYIIAYTGTPTSCLWAHSGDRQRLQM